ncbi:MAG: hypothetical protein ABS61_05535 [Microbacterium sp. SCN 70-18]|nr:MAG: hypothetical protein ABS61_05535 [Microbacterium sp. SCN 70-18]
MEAAKQSSGQRLSTLRIGAIDADTERHLESGFGGMRLEPTFGLGGCRLDAVPKPRSRRLEGVRGIRMHVSRRPGSTEHHLKHECLALLAGVERAVDGCGELFWVDSCSGQSSLARLDSSTRLDRSAGRRVEEGARYCTPKQVLELVDARGCAAEDELDAIVPGPRLERERPTHVRGRESGQQFGDGLGFDRPRKMESREDERVRHETTPRRAS